MLHVDDRLHDDQSGGQRQSGQHHAVEAHAQEVEDHDGGGEGHDRRDHGDQRRPDLHQEQDDEHQRQQQSEAEGQHVVVTRLVHVGGLPEEARVDRDPLETRLQRVQRGFDALGDLQGVRAWELLHHHDEAGTVVDDGITDERLVVLGDAGDVAQGHPGRLRGAGSGFQSHLAQVLGRDDGRDVADLQA